MSDSMVERVARAMAKRYDPTVTVFDAGTFIPLARSAIEAMREPTDAMKKTGEDAMPDGIRWSPEHGDAIDEYDPLPVWRAMISKAMEE